MWHLVSSSWLPRLVGERVGVGDKSSVLHSTMDITDSVTDRVTGCVTGSVTGHVAVVGH